MQSNELLPFWLREQLYSMRAKATKCRNAYRTPYMVQKMTVLASCYDQCAEIFKKALQEHEEKTTAAGGGGEGA